MNYDPKSMKAEEFISDAEIRKTIVYAEEHKHDAALIDALLEKARPKKSENGVTCAGLSRREASVLLACEGFIAKTSHNWRSDITPPPRKRLGKRLKELHAKQGESI